MGVTEQARAATLRYLKGACAIPWGDGRSPDGRGASRPVEGPHLTRIVPNRTIADC